MRNPGQHVWQEEQGAEYRSSHFDNWINGVLGAIPRPGGHPCVSVRPIRSGALPPDLPWGRPGRGKREPTHSPFSTGP